MTRILLVGESWVTEATHISGFDTFTTVDFDIGAKRFKQVLSSAGMSVDHVLAHEASEAFPSTLDELAKFDAVVLSDVGAYSILIHPDTWKHGRTHVNRLALLADWVRHGGGLAMAGGYMSFQGVDAKARFHGTAVEEVLPVDIDPFDDRIETPEGQSADVCDSEHPVVKGIEGEWPILLGHNRCRLKPGATLLASIAGDPLLAVRQVGAGRTLAWTSDISPHWCPQAFMDWSGYERLFVQAMRWLAGES